MSKIPKSALKDVVQKCPICGKKFKNKAYLIGHVERMHSDQIPKDWSASRYENYARTGKTHGTCVVCGKDTEWNESTWKYGRLCNDPKCKEKIASQADERNKKIYGKAKLLDDPEMQRKMVYSKRTSGTYTWEEDPSGKFKNLYDSTTSRQFLEMLDVFLNFEPSDVFSPSPNTYPYTYEGKTHQYIPDHYIASLNLEVEIKEPADNQNMHPKIQAVDKVKERLKDEAMERRSSVNYIKINGTDYREFFTYLNYLKGLNDNITNPSMSSVKESGLPADTNIAKVWDHVPKSNNCPASIREDFMMFQLEQLGELVSEATSLSKLDALTYRFQTMLVGVDPNYDFDKCVKVLCDRMDKCETISEYEDLYTTTMKLRESLKDIIEDSESGVEKRRIAKETYDYINEVYLVELESRIKIERYKNPLKIPNKQKKNVWFNNDYSNAKRIVDSLTESEYKQTFPNGEYVNSPYLIYREVAMYKETPVAFIEAVEFPWEKKKAYITVVTLRGKEYRTKGYAEYLCERFVLSDLRHIKKLVWKFDPSNTASIRLAKKLGFRLDPNRPKSDHRMYLKVHKKYNEKLWIFKESESIDTTDNIEYTAGRRVDKLNDVISQIDEIDLDGIGEASSITAEKQDTEYRPVFVFLSFTNTPFGKLIHTYTGQEYTHASLSLDTTLRHMVSFGQGYDGRFGFVPDESIVRGGYKMSGDQGRYALYMYLASRKEFNTIKSVIKQFTDKMDDLKYSFKGCINIALHKETHDPNSYFCSQFVASVLQTVNPKLFDRDSSLYTPGDLQFKSQKNYIKVDEGKIKEYDEKKADSNIKKILSRKGFKDVQVNYDK